MSKHIDADALIADMQERYCKPCKERKEDYNEVRCRACWVDDAMDEIDGFADKSIDIVRCRECKYASNDGTYGCMCEHFNDTSDAYHRMWSDDFCSRGERREP
jgi:hypothetical protein